jgi:hypothetical protein
VTASAAVDSLISLLHRIDNIAGTVWERIFDELRGLPDPDWRDLERTFCAKVVQPASGSRTAKSRSGTALQLLDPSRAQSIALLLSILKRPLAELQV